MGVPILARHLAATLTRASKTFPAILLTGSRQSGKTTLLRHHFGDTHRYVSLELPATRARAEADPVAFLRENSAPVIFDEIQYAPALLHHVKEAIDQDRSPGRWVLSGSQSLALMEGVSQTLAGRVAVLSLAPLSMSERAERPARSIDELLDTVFGGAATAVSPEIPEPAEILLRGGYPEPALDPAVDRTLWYGGYVQTYLERDVRSMTAVGDLAAFQSFLSLAATRSGRLLNMSAVGREAGVTGPTIKRWMSVLEATGVAFRLPPWHENFGKRLRKARKLVFLDTGLLTYLLGLHTPEPLRAGPSFGAVVETAVAAEWIKAFQNAGEPSPIHHWRTSGGLEVDLVIARGGRHYGIEVKATSTPTPRHADGLRRWLDLAGPRASGVVACLIDRPMTLAPGIRAVPWHLAWA